MSVLAMFENQTIKQKEEKIVKIGDWVLYKETEVGRVASFNRYGKPFVCYHLGETAALTPKKYLKNISEKEAKEKVRFGYKLEDIGGGIFD